MLDSVSLLAATAWQKNDNEFL